ncbi:hypothetical protein V1520DRAFT_350051, partial [Lipomyces starkeyi]
IGEKLGTKCTSFKVSIVLELLIVSLTVPTPSACTPPPKPSRRGRRLVSSSSNNSFWQHMSADAPLSISHLVCVPCVFSNAEAVMLSVGHPRTLNYEESLHVHFLHTPPRCISTGNCRRNFFTSFCRPYRGRTHC